jgi:adenylosuccinate synthase
MTVCAVLGGQWGDEAKGKIVDMLAKDADIVARFSGGNNAGHTVINDQGEFIFHLVPCGVLWPDVQGYIGNGVVVAPDAFLDEVEEIEGRGIDIQGRVLISERSHLVMPYHVVMDNLFEAAKGDGAIGTTGRGIGPAYTDKASRIGVRAADLLDVESLYPRMEYVLRHHNAVITGGYDGEAVDIESMFDKCRDWAARLKPFIGPVEHYMHDAADKGSNVIIEGAQGALLDLDHGTYPYVTSSHPTIGGAAHGLGLNPGQIDTVIGVFKAYSTRVGAGPFVTEITGDMGDRIRNLANEFGATTGRARRVGWFDSVVARYSHRINGYTGLVVAKLDILDNFDEINLCVAYELDGERVWDFPGSAALLERCKPIYETHPGWHSSTRGLTKLEDLPRGARAYVDRLEEMVGVPVDIISTGPHRDQTIVVKSFVQV